jgi:hypothetical protein
MAFFHAKYDVPRRRSLRLETVDDLATEVERIVAASHAGRVRTTGRWTPGQIFEHVAKLIEFSYDGFPFRASLPIRAAAHVAKWLAWKRFVAWALQPGYRLPANERALLPDAGADCAAAANRLRAAIARIRAGEPICQPSPFEGRLTHDQWVYAHLRHAELHLSFIEFFDERPS